MRKQRVAGLILGVLLLFVGCATEQTATTDKVKAFTGAEIFDGTGSALVEDGVIVVRNGRIDAVGARGAVKIPGGAEEIDVAGRYIIPGLINTHGHVGGTLGLETGYYSAENILSQLKLYARYGVTTVNSLGGDGPEAVQLRDGEDSDLDRARLLVAGTVVNGPSADEARKQVDENAALGVDFIKIRIDDNLGSTQKMSRRSVFSAVDQANKHGLPVAAHIFYHNDGRTVMRFGASFLVHSVRDQAVNADFIEDIFEYDASYCPTLMREVSTFVYESEPDFFSDPFFLKAADPAVLDQLKNAARQREIRNRPSTARYKEALETASQNLKTLADAGVRIAFGTDSGPPGRFQGYFEHMELALMADAGLTPEQILLSATRDAAIALFQSDVGTLEPNKWADFVVLTANPLDDIKNSRSIESVWIAGNPVVE